MGNIFFSSDTHFYHANIIKYCDRRFINIEQMDIMFIEEWNKKVSSEDTVYHLGDFALCSRKKLNALLDRLNFKKLFLIPGNHDDEKDWKKIAEQRTDIVITDKIHTVKGLTSSGQNIILCHYPLTTWDGNAYGTFHFYGHCHGTVLHPSPAAIDIGYDATGEVVLSMDEIISILTTKYLENGMIR